jgi:hypothetical protein
MMISYGCVVFNPRNRLEAEVDSAWALASDIIA